MSRAINLSHGKEKYPTKVVVRRLPPDLTLDAFLPRVSPLPGYDYLYFVRGGNSKFSRAYVNFERYEDVPIFRRKFDGLSFLGTNGVEYPAVVEFAPYQNVPASPKNADVTAGTIQSDGYYADFLDGKRREEEEVRRPEFCFRPKTVEEEEEEEEGRVTPLLKYVNERKRERKKNGGEKRKFFPPGKQRRYENCVVFVNSAAKKSHHVRSGGNRKLTFV